VGVAGKRTLKKPLKIQADYQGEALDYLKESDAIPRQYREAALGQQAGALGLEGGPEAQQAFYDGLSSTPMYNAIMGGQKAGEDSILRNQAATGGLRSGNTQAAMYDYNAQLQNQALLQSYNTQMSGLQGLAGLPSLSPVIANQTSGIGQTLAQGIIGGANSQQAANGMGMSNALGIASMFI
jgi:hypothetical protein